VDGDGRLTEVPACSRPHDRRCNVKIYDHLKERRAVAGEKIIHHISLLRCKSPILFRATEQWFCSIDGFKEDAIKAIDQVE
jgi:isoleucyl-tRNA synthetase